MLFSLHTHVALSKQFEKKSVAKIMQRIHDAEEAWISETKAATRPDRRTMLFEEEDIEGDSNWGWEGRSR